MRIAFEIPAILERPRLAFVDVDGHDAWRRLAAHDAPLAPRWKTGAAQTAQAGVFHRRERVLDGALAHDACFERRVATAGDVLLESDGVGERMGQRFSVERRVDVGDRRVAERILSDEDRRRNLATADARGTHHTHLVAVAAALQQVEKLSRAVQLAGQPVADAYGNRRRTRLVFFDDVEMMVEGRDLEDFGRREPHLFGKRDRVGRRDAPVAILDLVQVLDEQVAPARLGAEQHAHVFERDRIDRAPAAFTALLLFSRAVAGRRRARRRPERDAIDDVDRVQLH